MKSFFLAVFHRYHAKIKMWGMKSGRPEENLKLNEEMVIEKGAKLVGEGIIYGISATILFAAHAREMKKGAVKRRKERKSSQS